MYFFLAVSGDTLPSTQLYKGSIVFTNTCKKLCISKMYFMYSLACKY